MTSNRYWCPYKRAWVPVLTEEQVQSMWPYVKPDRRAELQSEIKALEAKLFILKQELENE